MKKLLTIIAAIVCACTAWAASEADGIYYETEAGEAYVVAGKRKYSGEVIIPATVTINGEKLQVKGIEEGAFKDSPDLIMVHLPSSITMIKDDFDECPSLRFIICDASKPPFTTGFADCSATLYVPKSSYGRYRSSPMWRCFSDVYNKEEMPTEIDGVYYQIETAAGKGNKYASVTYVSEKKGKLSIPQKVKIDGKTYVVKTIQDDAFERYNGSEIKIAKTVSHIGEMAFIGCCANLKSITVEEGNTKYASDNGALYDRHKTVLLTVPQAKEGVFNMPATVTVIEDRAFEGCAKITTINIPAKVEEINDVFTGCSNLTAINVDLENTEYDSGNGILFNKDRTELIRVPQTVSGEFSVPKYVSTIGYCAFEECKNITRIIIPRSVTDIDKWAFKNCTGLTAIEIPSSVKEIGDEILGDCTGLKYIRCRAARPPIIDADLTYDLDIPLYVPKMSLKKYKEGEFWMNFRNIRPSKELPKE